MEIWKDVIGYEGLYQVSNFCRIRNCKTGRILKQQKNKGGYLNLNLRKNNIMKRYLAHRLAAKAFIPNPDNKPQINHIDCNRQNNHISNLEWCDASHNLKHSYVNGIRSHKGENHPQAKLTNKDVYKIKQLLSENKLTQKAIAKMFDVKQNVISDIKNNKKWKHI